MQIIFAEATSAASANQESRGHTNRVRNGFGNRSLTLIVTGLIFGVLYLTRKDIRCDINCTNLAHLSVSSTPPMLLVKTLPWATLSFNTGGFYALIKSAGKSLHHSDLRPSLLICAQQIPTHVPAFYRKKRRNPRKEHLLQPFFFCQHKPSVPGSGFTS